MMLLLDLPQLQQLVARIGLRPLLRRLAGELAECFGRWPEFSHQPRLAHHVAEGVLELMPTADSAHFGCKYVNGHPGNPALNKLTVTAFGWLADNRTGYPLVLSEMTLLTALRTAATSALAAQYLAPPGARTMALIGTGAQAEFQALAFAELLGVTTIRHYDSHPPAMAKFAANLAGETDLRLVPAPDIATAVAGADIITTATAAKQRAVILPDALIRPGVHINAIGGDCPGKTELDPATLRRAQLVVEYEPQTRIEGEIQQLPANHPVTELWRLVTGAAAGRQDAITVTVFDSVGYALEDFATLRLIYALLRETGLGCRVDLIPEPADMRDLYALLRG